MRVRRERETVVALCSRFARGADATPLAGRLQNIRTNPDFKTEFPMPATSADETVPLIESLCEYIRTHLEEPLTLTALGEQAGMSPAHLQRVFKRVVGVSPRQFADACRLDRL